MKKAVKICCFTLGTALLLAALFLILHNVQEDKKSGEGASSLLDVLKQEIPDKLPTETMQLAEDYDLFSEYEEETTPEMETVEIDGNMYIGYIAIPALGVELPVLSEWSYPNLKISPCRYTGNLYENNLIICAHNYSSHFGRISSLHSDDEIIFTNVTGEKFSYQITNIEQLAGTAVEEIQFGNAEDWDLTLFTCTLNGQSRVTVRAVREEG